MCAAAWSRAQSDQGTLPGLIPEQPQNRTLHWCGPVSLRNCSAPRHFDGYASAPAHETPYKITSAKVVGLLVSLVLLPSGHKNEASPSAPLPSVLMQRCWHSLGCEEKAGALLALQQPCSAPRYPQRYRPAPCTAG